MPELPVALRFAVVVLVGEAALLAVLCAVLIYADLTRTAGSAAGAVAVTLFVAMLAALLALLGRTLWRRRRWARGPAVVLQLLALPMGYTMLTGGQPWLGVITMLLGLLGAGLLLAPSTRESLGAG